MLKLIMLHTVVGSQRHANNKKKRNHAVAWRGTHRTQNSTYIFCTYELTPFEPLPRFLRALVPLRGSVGYDFHRPSLLSYEHRLSCFDVSFIFRIRGGVSTFTGDFATGSGRSSYLRLPRSPTRSATNVCFKDR